MRMAPRGRGAIPVSLLFLRQVSRFCAASPLEPRPQVHQAAESPERSGLKPGRNTIP